MDFREEFGRIPPTLAFYSSSIAEAYHGRHHDGGPNKRVTALYAANSPYLTTLFNGTVAATWLMALAVLAGMICFGWGVFASHWIWIGAALFCGISVYMWRRVVSALMQIRTLILACEVLASDFAGWGSRFPDVAEWARGWVGRTTTDIRLLDLYIPPELRPAIERGIQPPSLLEEILTAKSGRAIPQSAADLTHDRAASGRT